MVHTLVKYKKWFLHILQQSFIFSPTITTVKQKSSIILKTNTVTTNLSFLTMPIISICHQWQLFLTQMKVICLKSQLLTSKLAPISKQTHKFKLFIILSDTLTKVCLCLKCITFSKIISFFVPFKEKQVCLPLIKNNITSEKSQVNLCEVRKCLLV